jgi:hypothetical protein
MRGFAGFLTLLPLLAGCAGSLESAGDVFVQPGKYQFLECKQIMPRLAGNASREKELTGLMDRANESAAGPVINVMVYGADLEQVRADRRQLLLAAREKNCPDPVATPPAPPPPPKRPRR